MAEQIDPDLARGLLRQVANTGGRATIQYMDSLRLVTPQQVSDDMLIAIDETGGGRVRRFRIAFIREVTPVAPEPVEEDDASTVGRPREMERPTRFELYLPARLLAQIDAARGEVPRAAWVRETIARRLGQSTPQE